MTRGLSTAQLRVLIADDHAPTREDLSRALAENARFSICAEVATAADAVELTLRERPDVCLLDVQMPGGGLSAAREIKARLPGTTVVMLSAVENSGDRELAARAGASAYLAKTLRFERLAPALLALLEG